MTEVPLDELPVKLKRSKATRLAAKRIEKNLADNYYKARFSQECHEKGRYRHSPSLAEEKHRLANQLTQADRMKHERAQAAQKRKREVALGKQEDLEGWQ